MNGILTVFRNLSDADVNFVLCGGMACVLQGCERTTQDMDICLSIDRENLTKAVRAFREMNMVPRIPEPIETLINPEKRGKWIKEKSAMVYYTLTAPRKLVQFDIFLHYPIPWDALLRDSEAMDLGGVTVKVSSRQQLISAKRKVIPPREKDLWDIRVLEGLNNEG